MHNCSSCVYFVVCAHVGWMRSDESHQTVLSMSDGSKHICVQPGVDKQAFTQTIAPETCNKLLNLSVSCSSTAARPRVHLRFSSHRLAWMRSHTAVSVNGFHIMSFSHFCTWFLTMTFWSLYLDLGVVTVVWVQLSAILCIKVKQKCIQSLYGCKNDESE